MNTAFLRMAARGRNVGKLLILPPLFLFVSLVPWLVVLGLKVLSDWFYADGWRLLGTSFKMLATFTAGALIACTVWFFIVWFVHLTRALRGSGNK